jgi:hypothetical protein
MFPLVGPTVNCYRQIQNRLENDEFGTGNAGYANLRRGEMIDFILASGPPFQVCDADIDRTMFTEDGEPVNCQRIDGSGRCQGTGHQANGLRMYSDHWAVWAGLTWFPALE